MRRILSSRLPECLSDGKPGGSRKRGTASIGSKRCPCLTIPRQPRTFARSTQDCVSAESKLCEERCMHPAALLQSVLTRTDEVIQ